MKKGFLDGYESYNTSNGFGNPRQWKDAFRQRMSKDDAEKTLKEQQETPYEILQISTGANQTEIKAAFRKLIFEWHPDKNQHRIQEAEEKSKKIIAAYSLLTQ